MCSHALFQTKTDRPVEDVFCVELRKRRFQEVNETIQFGQSPGISPSTPRKGAIRHYMISWGLGWNLPMNDKRHDSIGDRQAPTVTENDAGRCRIECFEVSRRRVKRMRASAYGFSILTGL